MKNLLLITLIPFLSTGCLQTTQNPTGAQHQSSLHSENERKMTLGVVQSSVKEGDSQADVAIALGSPNIVTQDGKGNDTWIYDKISTETSYSDSSRGKSKSVGGGAGILGLLGGSGILGGGAAINSSVSESNRSGASSQNQKTLTVVIKFDEEKKVNSIRTQSSSF